MNLLHDEKSQFLGLRFHSKTFLILPIAQHISLPSLSSLWPPEICSKGPSKVIGWILQTFTHKDDRCDSGNVLGWAEPLKRLTVLWIIPDPPESGSWWSKTPLETSTTANASQALTSSGFALCAYSPVLFTLLCCLDCFTPSEAIQSLSEAWLLTQSWTEMAGRASTLEGFAISEGSPRPGVWTQVYLLLWAEPPALLSKSQGPHLIRSRKDRRDWTQPQNKSLVKY